MHEAMPLRPIVAICGTTGVGKSQLAVELALALQARGAASGPNNTQRWRGARIVNADAMQVYAGLDVLTNKMPVEERKGIPHLLLGVRRPGEQYVVGEWVRDAIRAIDETHARGEIPIVVGGTAYWIQHLIFPNRLSKADETLAPSKGTPSVPSSEALARSLDSLPKPMLDLYYNLPEVSPSAASDPDAAFTLHSLLSALDPDVAARWHWKDTRKVLRSLEIIRETGMLASANIADQAREVVPPRYQTLCFWLYSDPNILNPRLDARVDQMVKQGLINEVRGMHAIVKAQTLNRGDKESSAKVPNTDYTLGIYQSIGYKDFRPYLDTEDAGSPNDQLFADAVAATKTSTRQYAKRQVSWLRNKLLPAVRAANSQAQLEPGDNTQPVPTYLLDATDVSEGWHTNVKQNAQSILDAFLEQRPLPDPQELSPAARAMLSTPDKPTDPAAVLRARRKMVCPDCTTDPMRPVMVEEGTEWDAHRRTKIHRYAAGVRNGTRRPRQKSSERSRRRDALQEELSNEEEPIGTGALFS